MSRRETLHRLIGSPVNDVGLFERALSHRSLLRGEHDPDLHSNERLEYLGDAVVGFLVAEYLYLNFDSRDEGFLTRLRAKLVNRTALAATADFIDLGPHILVSAHLRNSPGDLSDSIRADALEAIIGAIYLDLGLDSTRDFVHRTVIGRVDMQVVVDQHDNHKSTLLEYAQARKWTQPAYRVIDEVGPSHRKLFSVEVLLNDEQVGSGKAHSKKKAEQEAARVALHALRNQSRQTAGTDIQATDIEATDIEATDETGANDSDM